MTLNKSTKQWQCEQWYLHKTGFITASKGKRVFTRQQTLKKNPAENVKKLIEEIGLVKSCSPLIQEEREPQNAKEWGLLHGESARTAYQRVASHTHHRLKLIPKGFVISPSKPSLGASANNIQKCQCEQYSEMPVLLWLPSESG